MEETITTRFKRAWNIFFNKDPTLYKYYGSSTMSQPSHARLSYGGERSIANSIYNRIAMDCATIDIKHVRLDENGRYTEEMKSTLNECLTGSANIDQTGRALILDAVLSMLDEGHVAIVPVDTNVNPTTRDDKAFDVLTLRTGKITEWYPHHVRVKVYNENTGLKEEVVLPKSMVAIIENPFYQVMNMPNSMMSRLVRKLNLLDFIDENNSSGKLDLIIQLPYVIKTQARKEQAEQRRKDIEEQLSGSKYGIAYTDGTEHITQLNRAVENNLMSQIEFLTSTVYAQLGLTQEIMNGTADEKAMSNYYSRTIEPIMSALVEEMKRKFLSKTARTQGQTIQFFRDPFKLVPVADMAELADKFTRNEILTSNEVRQIVGMKPVDDPKADQLINSNINQSKEELGSKGVIGTQGLQQETNQAGDSNMVVEEIAEVDPNNVDDAAIQKYGDPNAVAELQELQKQLDEIQNGNAGTMLTMLDKIEEQLNGNKKKKR